MCSKSDSGRNDLCLLLQYFAHLYLQTWRICERMSSFFFQEGNKQEKQILTPDLVELLTNSIQLMSTFTTILDLMCWLVQLEMAPTVG